MIYLKERYNLSFPYLDGFLALGRLLCYYFKFFIPTNFKYNLSFFYYNFLKKLYNNSNSGNNIKLYSFDIFSTLLIHRRSTFFRKEKQFISHHDYACSIEKIKELLGADKKVILLAYSLYSSDFIRVNLLQFDSLFADIPIYVSSAYKSREKNLFKIISIAENVDYKNWRHFGNKNIRLALRLGINVL